MIVLLFNFFAIFFSFFASKIPKIAVSIFGSVPVTFLLEINSADRGRLFAHAVFSERELKFMFAICHRRSVCLSVCRLSVVCRL